MLIRYLVLTVLIVSSTVYAQNDDFYSKLDSIENLRELSRNYDLDLEKRLEHALNAISLSKELNIDSTLLRSNRYLAFVYLDMDKSELFREVNHDNLKLSQKLRDSSALGSANRNLGWYHAQELQNDSAYYYYYKAEKIYHSIKDIRKEGEALLNKADIQETVRDYIGSEASAVKAIKLIESLDENDRNLDTLWSLYNLLAVISERLGQHTEAIENYEKCIEVAKRMSEPLEYVLNSRHNIGFSYGQRGNLEEALVIYEEVFSNEQLLEIDSKLYVQVLSNIARTKHLLKNPDVEGIDRQFKEAYRLSDSLDDSVRLMSTMNYMSAFYSDIGKKDSAMILSKRAYNLGKEIENNDFVLKSLLLLSKLEQGKKSNEYLTEHIRLSDSLLQNERAIRNKFARIEFETDQLEAEKERLSKERLLFLIISIGLLMSLTLLYVVITQRAKNRKLEFIKKQQETNEEIYNLMLAQQDKIKEGRTKEKKRISEELHDGILGRLFGTRLSLDSLNMVKTDDAIQTRSQYINELKTIETEIRKISHDLNTDFVSGSSFMDIVRALVENQTQAYQLGHTFNEDDEIDWEEVPNKTKIHIYRMLQETMQNIYKHAQANHVKISFQLKNDVILVAIEDDGSGFNVNKARKGIGLKNIDSRVNDVGGKAEVFSKIDIGTVIKISIPIAS